MCLTHLINITEMLKSTGLLVRYDFLSNHMMVLTAVSKHISHQSD